MAAKIYKINFKSDFVLTVQSDAGWAIPFCVKFWTGVPSKAYFIGYDGTNYHNCRMGDTSDKLVVLFDDHHLPIGELQMQIAYHATIDEFPTVEFDEVTNPVMVTTEIDGEEQQVMLDFTGETAPEIQFSLPAYANEAQRIVNEQERERIFAEMQQAFATMQRDSAAATEGAENVNAQLNGTILTVTNRNGQSVSKNVQGPQGERGEQGRTGATGPQGPQGIQGPSGPAGEGVPEGGREGQVLKKKSDTDYDTEWEDESGGGAASYTPTLQNVPTSNTTTYVKDGEIINFEIGQFCRVANANSPKGYDMYQIYNLATESNVTTATWRLIPNNVACLEDTGQSALTPSFDPQNDTVHVTQQVLTSAQKAQARQNIGAADAGTSVASSAIRSIVTMTQSDYDNLATKDNTTLYIII